MATLTLRSIKGSPLTNNEMDANLIALNADKADIADITYDNLNSNGDIGEGADQVAAGNHTHSGYLATSGGTMTGELVTEEVTETVVAIAASSIDVSAGTYFYKTISGATTFTFDNPAASGSSSSFTLELTNAGENITWPGSVVWAGGTAPTLTATGVDMLVFHTRDGGTTWYGYLAGADFS